MDERRAGDHKAVAVAKETADAALEAHNQLIKQMREQAFEAQRQLDKLTDTYATKENLKTLETLIDQRLTYIDEGGRVCCWEDRGAWADLDLKGLIRHPSARVHGHVRGVIGLMVYLSQQ